MKTLLEHYRSLGVTITRNGDKLGLTGPESVLTQERVAEIKTVREKLFLELSIAAEPLSRHNPKALLSGVQTGSPSFEPMRAAEPIDELKAKPDYSVGWLLNGQPANADEARAISRWSKRLPWLAALTGEPLPPVIVHQTAWATARNCIELNYPGDIEPPLANYLIIEALALTPVEQVAWWQCAASWLNHRHPVWAIRQYELLTDEWDTQAGSTCES